MILSKIFEHNQSVKNIPHQKLDDFIRNNFACLFLLWYFNGKNFFENFFALESLV